MRVFQADKTETRQVLPLTIHKGMRISNGEEAVMAIVPLLKQLGNQSITVMGYSNSDFLNVSIDWLDNPDVLFAVIGEMRRGGMKDVIGTPEVLLLNENIFEIVEGVHTVLHTYVITREDIVEVVITGKNPDELDARAAPPAGVIKCRSLENIQGILFQT